MRFPSAITIRGTGWLFFGTQMKKIDLHLHSYYSDGENSPEEILSFANDNNLKIFSITDHNYISDRIDVLKQRLKKDNIEHIEGIELSCFDRKKVISIHMLGYSKNFKRKINKELEPIIEGYNKRAFSIIKKLNGELPGVKLDFNEIISSGHEKYVSRNTLAHEVVKFLNNQITIKEALKRYVFVEEDNSWIISPQTAIDIIKRNNGVAVLAHSGNILEKLGEVKYEHLVKKLISYGLEGIEVFYPKHNLEQQNKLEKIACDNNLLVTGGSDWHGNIFTPNKPIGVIVQEKHVKKLLNRVQVK